MKAKLTEKLIDKLEVTGKRYDVRDESLPGLLVRVGATGGKVYYLDFRDAEGKRSKYRIGPADAVPLADAREESRRKSGAVASGQNLNKAKREHRRKKVVDRLVVLGTFIDEVYKPWRRAERRRAEEELDRLELHFKSWYDKPMTEIDESLVLGFRRERLVAGIGPKTINRDVACIRSVLRHAVTVKVIDSSPLQFLKPLKTDDRERVRFLSYQEADRLRKTLADREQGLREGRASGNRFRSMRGYELKPDIPEDQYVDHIEPITLTLLNTGVRPEELLLLEWRDLCFQNRTLTVRGDIAKSGRTRHIPLSSEAVSVIKKWRRSSQSKGLVFPGAKEQPMERLPRALTRCIAAAGIEKFRPYDLRHTFASWLALKGVDLNTIRELLGHEDISTTLIYAHLTQDHRRDAVAKVFG